MKWRENPRSGQARTLPLHMLPESGSTPDETAASSPPQRPGAQSLTVLADVVERFASAWRMSDIPPDLVTFLPESPAVRRVSLIELVKVDLENRWLHDKQAERLTQYCEELPELRDWPLPPDLIYEEFHVRRRSGQIVDAAEYTKTSSPIRPKNWNRC